MRLLGSAVYSRQYLIMVTCCTCTCIIVFFPTAAAGGMQIPSFAIPNAPKRYVPNLLT